jgi:hypothetical protein
VEARDKVINLIILRIFVTQTRRLGVCPHNNEEARLEQQATEQFGSKRQASAQQQSVTAINQSLQ